MQRPAADFLYVNIGRGHPFYLDGIHACLPESLVGEVRDVLDLSRGPFGTFWRLARWLYAHGSSHGGSRPLYAQVRGRVAGNRRSLVLRLLGLPLARALPVDGRVLLVGHPLLVAMLPMHERLVYQHGDLAVPREALVPGPQHVLVPDAAAADAYRRAGFAADRVHVTGLCVEPALAPSAADAVRVRAARLARAGPLTGAFLSSGAEPRQHVQVLVSAAVAAVSAGGRAMLVAHLGGRYHKAAVAAFAARGLALALADAEGALAPTRGERATLCLYRTRRALEHATAVRFAEWDYVCAPAHERSHWALGLGLPMFIVAPSIGTFAPLNRARLLAEGVAEVLDPGAFDAQLRARHADGALAAMAATGWGRYPINGFSRAAEIVTGLAGR